MRIRSILFLLIIIATSTFAQFSKNKANPLSNTLLLSLGGGLSHSDTDYPNFNFSLNGSASAEYFFETNSDLFYGLKLQTDFTNLSSYFDKPKIKPDLDLNIISIGPSFSVNQIIGEKFIPYVSIGSKYLWYHDFTTISVVGEIGVRYLISDYFALNCNAQLNFINEDDLDNYFVSKSSNDFYSSISIGFSYAVDLTVSDDLDGDGIKNADDSCPEQAEDFDGFEDSDGCPEYDNDQDGIIDLKDNCVNEAEDFDGFEDADGCPDPDNDGDGILDVNDECPDLKEDFDGFEDSDGCPELDNDNDGILDSNDGCPNEPETFNRFEDFDGCPDTLTKNTGIEEEVEIKEKPENNISKEKIVRVAISNEFILEGDELFELNSTDLKNSSYNQLDQIASQMLSNQDFKWRIEGHLDNSGSRNQLKALSTEWANSVMKYFVSKGLSPNSFQVIGMGDTFPLAPNSSIHGKLKNRRIVIKRIR